MSEVDVVVIGGGLAGCAASYYLARDGARVALLEKAELNRGASGQNAGSLHFQLEFRMIEHGSRIAEQYALAIPLNLDAISTWASLEDELGLPLEVHQRGGLMVAESDEELDALTRKHALEREHGLPTEMITGDEARNLEPGLSTSIVGAAYASAEGHANARLVAPSFAAAAARRGVAIRPHTRVVGLTRRGGRWRATLSNGEEVASETVVVAAGTWSAELLAMTDVRIPLVPVALTMLATAAAVPIVSHLIQHAGRRLSLKQAGDGNVLVGGGWPAQLVHSRGRIDLDQRPRFRFDSIVGSAATAVRVVPAVGSLALIRAWTGTTAVSADGIPLFGEVPRRPGLFLIAGSGFVRAPTLARELSRLILAGATSFDLGLYSPTRFAHLNFR